MGKNCLEEYLTESCQNCEFWRNDEMACGCNCPFPIMHCEAFAKMYNEAEKILEEREMKEKLIELLITTFDEQYEKRRLITPQHTAEFLIANGVTLINNSTEKGGEGE